ncbi:MAG: cohesin domain-containing protein [Thermodesulfobacteriota bacterium]
MRITGGSLTAGGETDIPVMIDRVDNLAGAKLVISYDKEVLRFRDLQKGEKAAALMHVVNDKEPGRLIVVMAGAKGISGEQFPLVSLQFTVAATCPEIGATTVNITEAQLMSDTLEDLSHQQVPGRFVCQSKGIGRLSAGSGGQ